ncbi:uncharacterized protein IWZ02DRAFT_90634 [Phyllosticta citriasiana]|uniref:uncharacterized protein n=1 Tax=Phyllosticta citriasiana TaxID=595635 RepID=UPI0030FD72EC
MDGSGPWKDSQADTIPSVNQSIDARSLALLANRHIKSQLEARYMRRQPATFRPTAPTDKAQHHLLARHTLLTPTANRACTRLIHQRNFFTPAAAIHANLLHQFGPPSLRVCLAPRRNRQVAAPRGRRPAIFLHRLLHHHSRSFSWNRGNSAHTHTHTHTRTFPAPLPFGLRLSQTPASRPKRHSWLIMHHASVLVIACRLAPRSFSVPRSAFWRGMTAER